MARFPGVGEVRVDARSLTTVHFELNYNDASGTYTIPVKKGTFVHTIGTVVTTVFDGSPTLTIGDGDDADGFLDSADIAPGTAATGTTPAVKLAEDGGNPYANGKYYASEDTIDFVWTKDAAGTTGKLKGFVVMSNLYNDGISAAI
jgi:hypothetical protein